MPINVFPYGHTFNAGCSTLHSRRYYLQLREQNLFMAGISTILGIEMQSGTHKTQEVEGVLLRLTNWKQVSPFSLPHHMHLYAPSNSPLLDLPIHWRFILFIRASIALLSCIRQVIKVLPPTASNFYRATRECSPFGLLASFCSRFSVGLFRVCRRRFDGRHRLPGGTD